MDNFNLQKFVKESKNEFYTNLYEGKKKHSMEEEMHDDDHKMEEKMNDDDHKMEEKMHEDDHKMEEKMHDDDHKMEENHQSLDKEVADRIEGLLRIPLKAKFLATGFDLINDLLEDDEFDVADIVSHLANELERMYYKASKPSFYGGLEEGKEEKETIKEITTVEFMELLPSVAGGMAALIGSSLGVTVFMEKAKEGKYGAKIQKLAKGIESAGGAAAKSRNVAEQEEEEVEMGAEVEDTMEIPAEIPSEEMDSKEVFSQLVDAYEAAKELGDEKLTRQLANTITYFNKTIIFGDEE